MKQTRKFYPSSQGWNYRRAWIDCNEWACVLLIVAGGFLALSVLSENFSGKE